MAIWLPRLAIYILLYPWGAWVCFAERFGRCRVRAGPFGFRSSVLGQPSLRCHQCSGRSGPSVPWRLVWGAVGFDAFLLAFGSVDIRREEVGVGSCSVAGVFWGGCQFGFY